MSDIPVDLLYLASHEWVRDNGDGTVTVGITDHAQALLGDIVFVELPEEGTVYGAEDACAVIESVKSASDLYSPLGGEVVAINDALEDSPESVNTDPYGDGWIFALKLENPDDLSELMNAEAYSDSIEEE